MCTRIKSAEELLNMYRNVKDVLDIRNEEKSGPADGIPAWHYSFQVKYSPAVPAWLFM